MLPRPRLTCRGLHLDDARAETGQPLAAVGARHTLAQLQDGEVAEDTARFAGNRHERAGHWIVLLASSPPTDVMRRVRPIAGGS